VLPPRRSEFGCCRFAAPLLSSAALARFKASKLFPSNHLSRASNGKSSGGIQSRIIFVPPARALRFPRRSQPVKFRQPINSERPAEEKNPGGRLSFFASLQATI